MDCTTCYCRMPRCPLFGQVAPRAQFTWHAWHRQAPRWRCRACRALVSARTGTAYAGIGTEGTTYLRGAVALAAGLSIRATGRLLDVDKDTVNPWLPVLGRHSQSAMNYFFGNLHLCECQLDELWTFVAKKEDCLTPLEKLATVYSDAWVWIAFSPVCKLVPAWVVGKRTLQDAHRLVLRLKGRLTGPFRFSPATPYYTMPTPCWRGMVYGAHRPGKGHVGVCPNRSPLPTARRLSGRGRNACTCTTSGIDTSVHMLSLRVRNMYKCTRKFRQKISDRILLDTARLCKAHCAKLLVSHHLQTVLGAESPRCKSGCPDFTDQSVRKKSIIVSFLAGPL
jgi:transposase-like protein